MKNQKGIPPQGDKSNHDLVLWIAYIALAAIVVLIIVFAVKGGPWV